MTLWFRHGAAALVLGVVTSWLLAWGVAMTGPEANDGARQWRVCRASSEAWSWYVTARSSFGHRAYVFRAARDGGEAVAPPAPRLPRWAMVNRIRMRTDAQGFGWPRACARLVTGWGGGEHDGLAVSRRARLPLTPIWAGLVGDALVWGAAGGGAAWAWVAAVRRRRRKRGLCAWCAYELAGLERCPECGRGARR